MDTRMARRLVVSIDGTNNAPGTGATNIQRLNRMLVRSATQVLYYQPGVGTVEPGSLTTRFGRRALMTLDAMSAVLLRRHVSSAYRFLIDEWQQGDELYLFGFSRGAYAVRVLAAMLSKVGLLHRGQGELVDFAWDVYRTPDNREQANEFRNAYGRYVPSIRFLGLFDTVSAVGTPWRPRTFERTFTNHRVRTVRHALALDEHRAMFVQNLWRDGDGDDVEQVWFAGAHADVGGGYPDAQAGLSLLPLAWMRDEAARAGLTFRPRLTARLLRPLADPALALHAPAHDELARQPAWHLLEWLPLPRWRPDGAGGWVRRWRPHLGRARRVPPRALVHASVDARMRGTGYLPRAALDAPRFVPAAAAPAAPAAPTMFRVVPLGARRSVALEYGDPRDPHRVLVDDGTAPLAAYADARPDGARPFELVVVAYADRARSDNVRTWLAARGGDVAFEDLWFNGRDVVAEAVGDDAARALPDEALSELLARTQRPWNVAFDGNAVCVADADEPPVVELDGGLRLTLVAPARAELAAPDAGIAFVAEYAGERVLLGTTEAVGPEVRARLAL
jgi:hypothetical protein